MIWRLQIGNVYKKQPVRLIPYYKEVTGAGKEVKTRPSCADVVGKLKKSDFFNGEEFFLLTSPLMGNPLYFQSVTRKIFWKVEVRLFKLLGQQCLDALIFLRPQLIEPGMELFPKFPVAGIITHYLLINR